MKNRNRGHDPALSMLVYEFEHVIYHEDVAARNSESVETKDSAVKSAVRKTELALAGKSPKNAPQGALEEWTAALTGNLVATARSLMETGGASRGGVLEALSKLRGSIDTRREMDSGNPRGYLDFLTEFMADAHKHSNCGGHH